MANKRAVLIHGLYLGVPDWARIMFGEPERGKVGRVLRGLKLAHEEDAKYIFFGSGASEKDGVKEGQYIFQYALQHVTEIAQYLGINFDEAEQFIRGRSIVITNNTKTREEIAEALRYLGSHDYDFDRLYLVTSPVHMPRAVAEGEVLRLGEYCNLMVRLYSAPSDVDYEGALPGDTVVIEPEHRGDRNTVHPYPLYVTARKIMKTSRFSFGAEFLTALAEFVEPWWKRGS